MPKCEIFNLLDSRDFYTIKPPWVGDFGTVIKNSKLFRYGHDFKVFPRNFELAYVEHAQKKLLGRELDQKLILLMVDLNPFASFKNDFVKSFTLWVFFTFSQNYVFYRMH